MGRLVPDGQLVALCLDRAACGEAKEEVLAHSDPAGQLAALLPERDAVVDDIFARLDPTGQFAALCERRRGFASPPLLLDGLARDVAVDDIFARPVRAASAATFELFPGRVVSQVLSRPLRYSS